MKWPDELEAEERESSSDCWRSLLFSSWSMCASYSRSTACRKSPDKTSKSEFASTNAWHPLNSSSAGFKLESSCGWMCFLRFCLWLSLCSPIKGPTTGSGETGSASVRSRLLRISHVPNEINDSASQRLGFCYLICHDQSFSVIPVSIQTCSALIVRYCRVSV